MITTRQNKFFNNACARGSADVYEHTATWCKPHNNSVAAQQQQQLLLLLCIRKVSCILSL
jgi:hypothetical protein